MMILRKTSAAACSALIVCLLSAAANAADERSSDQPAKNDQTSKNRRAAKERAAKERALKEQSAKAQAAEAQAAKAAGRLTCAELDALRQRSWEAYILPSICRTLTGDFGGYRSALAQYGIGFQGIWIGSQDWDLNGKNRGRYGTGQTYGGQRPTYFSGLLMLGTLDLGRYGLPEGTQLTFAGSSSASNLFDTQNYTNVSALSMYHQMAGGALSLEYGYMELGRVTGMGALSGSAAQEPFGPQAAVLLQAGMSSLSPTPTAMITIRDKESFFYNKTAIARSISPLGIADEQALNPTGMNWSVPGASPLYLNEFGYKRPASSSSNALWVLLGGLYNSSDFNRLNVTTPGKEKNWAIYGAASSQITNPHGDPRGWYVAGKFDYSNEKVNAFYADYSASVFNIGPFESRPADLASLSWSQSFISNSIQKNLDSYALAYGSYYPGPFDATSYTTSLTGTYAYFVQKGIYTIGSLSYVTNPTIAPKSKDAVISKLSVTIAF